MLILTPEWIKQMRADVENAAVIITLSALSVHPPKPDQITPFSAFMHALASARKRGVQVRAWATAPHASHPAAALNEAARRWFLAHGMEFRLVSGGRLLHAKTLTVDGQIGWVGSGNFTAAAAHSNHEAYLRVECDPDIKQLVNYLESLA